MLAAPAERNQVRTRCQRPLTPGPIQRGKSQNPLLGVVCLLTIGGLLCGRMCQALFATSRNVQETSPARMLGHLLGSRPRWGLRQPWGSRALNHLLSVSTLGGLPPYPVCALGACEAS